MSDMIERVAVTIYHSDPSEPPDFGAGDEGVKNHYRRIARAAIAAMRKATPEMLEAGWGASAPPQGQAERMWLAMIDAALFGDTRWQCVTCESEWGTKEQAVACCGFSKSKTCRGTVGQSK